MKNLNTVELRCTATEEIISRKDLSIDPDMQMRAAMVQNTVEEYADNIAEILEEHPLSVVEIEEATGIRWMVVDGFHRYHAAVMADLEEIPVKLMKGTFKDAQIFAMSSNWQHGERPKGADAKRSVETLLEYAPAFEYDSKEVTKYLVGCGVPRSTANKHTVKLRADIDAKRDAKILELHDAGRTRDSIAEELGCSQGTVSNTTSSRQNCSVSENDETQEADVPPFDIDEPMFDEEDLDTAQAINPADAFQKALDEHEAERQEATRQQDKSVSSTPNVSSKGNISLEERIKEALRAAGIYEDHTKAEVNKALFNVSQGN